MPRILADLPEEDIKWLEARAAEQGKSRAAMLRDAVSAYKAQTPSSDLDWLEEGFGAWTREGVDSAEAAEWQRRERASWTRPWDENYEEVKAEFPDLFDEEDDRQRQVHLDMLAGRYPKPKKPKSE